MRSIIFKSGFRALKSRPAIAVYTAGIVIAFFGGVAYASIPGPTGVINACYATKSPHTLRVIDSTQKCPSGTTALNWNASGPAGPGGVNGIQEFMTPGSWVAPAGITHVMVEAWGAGGGGGGEQESGACSPGAGAGGGGGGGGGYIRAVISVTSGQTYTIAIGAGGGAGTTGSNGLPGGNSSVSLGGLNLIVADGGDGGIAGASFTGGSGGVGGSASSIAGILRPGASGINGQGMGCIGELALGGDSYAGTVAFSAYGGSGGEGNNVATAGGIGYMLLTW